jgi:hypothetical protein
MTAPPDTTPQLPGDVRPPPRRRHRARKVLLIVGGAFTGFIVLIVIIAVANSGNKITPAAVNSPPPPTTFSTPPTVPTPTPSAPLTGSVGSGFVVTGANGPSGANTVYNVTLDKVDQQASLGSYETLTNGNDHVTGAEFTIAGTSGATTDDANSDAVAVGTDGQDYTPSFDTITDGTNFNSGDFNVAAGQTVNGWVSFELPPGVTIASVQWTPGIGGQTATWTVGS